MSSHDQECVLERWPEVAHWLESFSAAESVRTVDLALAPTLEVEGIRLESAVDPSSEAALQAELIPAGAEHATLYGCGQGSLARELLSRPGLSTLTVVLLAPRSIREVLARLDQSWLADPRVRLVRGDLPSELEGPFAVVPSALRLAEPSCARLADLIRLELATPHIRRHLERQEALWSSRVTDNLSTLEQDADVTELFGIRAEQRIVVAAPGPSLGEHLHRLGQENDCLIAVDAALGPLLNAGVVPDYVVTIDAHEDGMRRVFDVSKEKLSECTLVYLPTVLPAVIQAWPGPRVGAFVTGSYFDDFPHEVSRGRLWCSGSVFHAAVDLAVRMGASEIELCGADFAHIGGRTHVKDAAWSQSAKHGGPCVRNGHGEEVPSLPNLVGYLRDLERYIARSTSVRFLNASRSGARIEGAEYREGVSVG